MAAISEITDKAKLLVSSVTDVVTTATKTASDRLERTETGRTIKKAGVKTVDFAGEVTTGVSSAAEKAVNNINGTEALRRIEELVAQQRRYNDVLATRLAEALTRIDHLEQQVKQLSNER